MLYYIRIRLFSYSIASYFVLFRVIHGYSWLFMVIHVIKPTDAIAIGPHADASAQRWVDNQIISAAGVSSRVLTMGHQLSPN